MIELGPNDPLPTIPRDVATCPICDADLVVDDIDEWDPDTGYVDESGLHYGCVTEPDIDGPDWRDWFHWHYRMPYVDWLPLDAPVTRWFNEHYVYRPSLPDVSRLDGDAVRTWWERP